jgi:asparagine synthase (glutamine-hydrolysing)
VSLFLLTQRQASAVGGSPDLRQLARKDAKEGMVLNYSNANGFDNSGQFVGYWGYGDGFLLDNLLSGVTNTENLGNSQSANFQLVWNVAYLSDDIDGKFFANDKLLAGISVSGQYNSVDAWVRLGENNSLILGREVFGRSPLYWMRWQEVILFASHLQLLLSLQLQNSQVSQVSIPGLYGYSCFSYVPTPLTPVENIFSIPAGHEVVWNSQDISQTLSHPKTIDLWEWKENEEQITDEVEAVSQLQTLLKDSINRQITDLKDQPVGVLLSGGLDSSVVAALLVEAGVKVRGYTLDFGALGIPEYPYAEKVARHLGIPLVKVEATPKCIEKALIPTVKALDLPFGDGVTVPLYLLSQRASQETRVIFNGEGGDQLFAGWTNKPLIAAGIYQSHHPQGEETFIQQYLKTFHRLWGYEAKVYQPQVYEKIQNLNPEEWLKESLDPNFSLLHRLRRASLMLKGAQNIHPRATNLGLACGLTVRLPFCDLPLAQWTFSLSGQLTLQGACEKYILKRSVEHLLPEEIVWRQKRGMGVPLTSWCLNHFWHHIGKWLNPGILNDGGVFQKDIAAKIINGELGAAITGRRIGEILWLLIMWELWRVHVLGQEIPTNQLQNFNHPFLLPPWLWKSYKRWKV